MNRRQPVNPEVTREFTFFAAGCPPPFRGALPRVVPGAGGIRAHFWGLEPPTDGPTGACFTWNIPAGLRPR